MGREAPHEAHLPAPELGMVPAGQPPYDEAVRCRMFGHPFEPQRLRLQCGAHTLRRGIARTAVWIRPPTSKRRLGNIFFGTAIRGGACPMAYSACCKIAAALRLSRATDLTKVAARLGESPRLSRQVVGHLSQRPSHDINHQAAAWDGGGATSQQEATAT